MKLRNIFESGISRRDFLKRGVAGAVSLSPLGKLLASSGVAPAIVKSVEAGIVKPWTFPFTVMTNTHYGRGGSPLLSRQFENVGRAASLTRRLTSGGMKFGADEDAFFAGELSAQKFADIVKAAKDEEDIEINGQIFQAFDDEDSIYLEPYEGDAYIHVYKNGIPNWMNLSDIEKGESPVESWWYGYGEHGDEPLDKTSVAIIKKYKLDMSQRDPLDTEYYKQEMEGDEFERHEPERYNPRADDHIYGSSMHQPFESKLNNVLENICYENS